MNAAIDSQTSVVPGLSFEAFERYSCSRLVSTARSTETLADWKGEGAPGTPDPQALERPQGAKRAVRSAGPERPEGFQRPSPL